MGDWKAPSIHLLISAASQLRVLQRLTKCLAYASCSALEALDQFETGSCARIGAAKAGDGVDPANAAASKIDATELVIAAPL
jgi:hypothetical protein